MDIKKILSILIISLALFSCVGAASAGLFDFFGGGGMETHTFSGFSLDIPSGSNINENYVTINNVSFMTSNIESGSHNFTVYLTEGSVVSKEKYISNWVSDGATNEGTHGNWTIIKEKDGNYRLAKHGNSRIIEIRGDDLEFLKKIVDSYKEA